MAIIDIEAGFKELRLVLAQVGRYTLSGDCDKLAFTLLDVF